MNWHTMIVFFHKNMRDSLLLLLFSIPFILLGQLWDLSPVTSIPEPVSNNAVAAAVTAVADESFG